MTGDLLLSDRYRLVRLLAVGGMGEVWEATDEVLGRPVAVKLLRFEHISDERARSRFRAEARFAGSLQHSGIAQVYDFGEQDDQVYLVMELVVGETLAEVLDRRGRFSAEITLGIIAQAARALQVAHTAGIIHRDIKPGNLMVTDDDILKITDFGIARDGEANSHTATGMVMGTAHYVSPEQATGRTITGASDLYSLGVVAFQCLTGEPPFDGNTAVEVAAQHVHDAPPPLPRDVPQPVRELVARLLIKDPGQRPSSAQAVADQASGIRASIVFGVSRPQPVVTADPTTTGPMAVGATTSLDRTAADLTRNVAPVSAYPLDELSDGYGGDDTVTDDDYPRHLPERRRGSARMLAVVGAAILVLGVIMVGSLWQGSDGARFIDEYRPGPAPSQEAVPGLPGPAQDDYESPLSPTPIRRSVAPRPRETPTVRPTPNPKPTRPSPRPTRTTPKPSETPDPSDDPTSSPSGPGPGA